MPPLLQNNDSHRDCDLHYAGAPLDRARLVVVAAHGRNGSTKDILKLSGQVDSTDVAWVAPQATNGSWWGESFLAPMSKNEPDLTSALNLVSEIIDDLHRKGFGAESILLTGFSQGACLMLEHVARNPKPLRGVVAMSGGLIGSSEGNGIPCTRLNGFAPKKFNYDSNLTNLPIHMGCHIDDPVIPIARVRHSADVLRGMGAMVNVVSSPRKMHGVLPEDILALAKLLETPVI